MPLVLWQGRHETWLAYCASGGQVAMKYAYLQRRLKWSFVLSERNLYLVIVLAMVKREAMNEIIWFLPWWVHHAILKHIGWRLVKLINRETGQHVFVWTKKYPLDVENIDQCRVL